MWLCEKIAGNRKTYGMNLIGGVRRDLPKEIHPEILEVMAKIETETAAVVNAIAGDGTLKARLSGVGLLPEEAAREFAVVGPTARGSNVDIDARVDHPYAAYAELEPQMKTQPAGDNWAAGAGAARGDDGVDPAGAQGAGRDARRPNHDRRRPRCPGRAVGRVCGRGAAGRVDPCGADRGRQPARALARTRSHLPEPAGPAYMIKDETIADVPIILGSMDPCFSCTERVEVISARSGESHMLTQEDLLARSRAATERLRGR